MATTKPTVFERTLSFREAKIDDERRTVELSFSSEEPVQRYSWEKGAEVLEILSHEKGAVDLSRLGDNEHPLLLNHDMRQQIGVLENARIDDDKKGRCTARFSRSQLAEEIWRDVKDGIRRKVSVRYELLSMIRSEKPKTGLETCFYRWLPMEVSIVSIPADATVGVGREQELTPSQQTKTIPLMSEENKTAPQPAPASVSILQESAAVLAEERKRCTDIKAIARKVKHLVTSAEDRADAAISEGWTVDKFQRHMLELMPSAQPVARPAYAELKQKDMARYSIGNLIRGLIHGKVDGLERELSDELSRATGMQSQGAWLPHSILAHMRGQRDNLFVTGTLGGNVSPTNLLSAEYIDALRVRPMVIQMGARVLTGLTGIVTLPRLDTPAAITGKTEGEAYATSTPEFGQVTLSPKIAPGLVRFSKLLAVQSNPAIENLVRDDLVRQINIEVDRQCLHGSGSGAEATGIAGQGIAAIATVITGITPSLALCVSLETEVAQDNADMGALGYLTNSKVRGVLKQVLKNTNAAEFVWEYNRVDPTGLAVVNGYKAGATNQVKSNLTSGTMTTSMSAIFFGNWNDLILGYFGGGIDLTVDTISVPGWVAVHGQQYFDVGVRHAESFAWTNNARNTNP